jgi:hypothetical protein
MFVRQFSSCVFFDSGLPSFIYLFANRICAPFVLVVWSVMIYVDDALHPKITQHKWNAQSDNKSRQREIVFSVCFPEQNICILSIVDGSKNFTVIGFNCTFSGLKSYNVENWVSFAAKNHMISQKYTKKMVLIVQVKI